LTKKEIVPLEEALAQARAIAPKLAASTDALNKSIVEVEAALKSLRLGVSASVLLDMDDDRGWQRHLTFAKRDKEWHLLIEEFDDREDVTWEPLTNSSREIRLKSVRALSELVVELVRAAEEELQEVTSATASVKEFAASLKSREEGT